MAAAGVRRNISFDLLNSNSSGDKEEDFSIMTVASMVSRNPTPRRRRRSKHKKNASSSSLPVSLSASDLGLLADDSFASSNFSSVAAASEASGLKLPLDDKTNTLDFKQGNISAQSSGKPRSEPDFVLDNEWSCHARVDQASQPLRCSTSFSLSSVKAKTFDESSFSLPSSAVDGLKSFPITHKEDLTDPTISKDHLANDCHLTISGEVQRKIDSILSSDDGKRNSSGHCEHEVSSRCKDHYVKTTTHPSKHDTVVSEQEIQPVIGSPRSYQNQLPETENGYSTPKSSEVRSRHAETPQMLQWKQLVAEDSDGISLEWSPYKYIMGQLTSVSSLQSTTFVGDEQERQYVYNTMFHVPWRCELLIDIGFLVCLDSFLSLFTVMPARILIFGWERLSNWRNFRRLYAEELSDIGCLIVLVTGVAVLQQADISFIYHSIRFQPSVKLYVVYNVLEVFDKLCQSFGGDVLQVLFNSAVGVANCSQDRVITEAIRFCFDQCIAIFAFILHSLILLSEAVTVSAALNPTAKDPPLNKSLLLLLISNNFGEIKSNVFKRVSKENLHKWAYHDTVERFHILTCLFFVFVQSVMLAGTGWMKSFFCNAALVLTCEVIIDAIKHSFLAKFNDIKPAAYSEFLEALCKQVVKSQHFEVRKALTFVPLAPACVVLRVLIPLYASYLPQHSIWLKGLCAMFLIGLSFFFLAVLKLVVGLGLQAYARWYLKRSTNKLQHFHKD